MKYMYSALSSRLNDVLAPNGFEYIDECFCKWDRDTGIVTVVSFIVDDASDFAINIGAKSVRQGFNSMQALMQHSLNIAAIGCRYGQPIIDNINRSERTGKRIRYTAESFNTKLQENIDRLEWCLKHIFNDIDGEKLFNYLSVQSSYCHQYGDNDTSRSIPEPFAENFYLAASLERWTDAARLILFIYNANRLHDSYRSVNSFDLLKNKFNIELDSTLNEWYMHTFHMPSWHILAHDVLVKRNLEWMYQNEPRILETVKAHLLERKRPIYDAIAANTSCSNLYLSGIMPVFLK